MLRAIEHDYAGISASQIIGSASTSYTQRWLKRSVGAGRSTSYLDIFAAIWSRTTSPAASRVRFESNCQAIRSLGCRCARYTPPERPGRWLIDRPKGSDCVCTKLRARSRGPLPTFSAGATADHTRQRSGSSPGIIGNSIRRSRRSTATEVARPMRSASNRRCSVSMPATA